MIYKATDDKEVMAAAEAEGLSVEHFLDGKHAAVEVPEEKPKIKMTKERPSESGWYFYTLIEGMLPVTVFVDDQLQREGNMINGRAQMIDVADIGGYWAKVDQSMFEFEGK